MTEIRHINPKFDIVRTASGEVSIRNNIVGEIMHNPVGPWAEANLLYIEASRFRHHALTSASTPLVVYDIGLGAAANALATIVSYESAQKAQENARPLRIISFENDLSLLEFVIERAGEIPYIGTRGNILASLLKDRTWTSPDGTIAWHLHEGNFLDTVSSETHSPDIVFYDPYSPAVNSEMWSVDAFTKLYARTSHGEHPCSVYTYSRATPVRTAMLAAGFFVGNGPRSGLKNETTQAATRKSLLADPLDQRWLLRWLRSHTRFQEPCSEGEKRLITNEVLSHPQFTDHHLRALLGWRQLSLVQPRPCPDQRSS